MGRADADHCPGVGATVPTLRTATYVALVSVTRIIHANGTFPRGSYSFIALRTYKGDLGITFRLTGTAMSCRWPPNEMLAVGDWFVITLGKPDQDADARAYWQVDPGDRILAGGHKPDEPIGTLAALERVIARSALTDTATDDHVAGTTDQRAELTSLAQLVSAAIGAWSFWRRRRSAAGGASSQHSGDARLRREKQ